MPIEWREPGTPRTPALTTRPRPAWADELIAHPKQWAMVETYPFRTLAKGVQYSISRKLNAWQKEIAGEWEASYRDAPSGYELFVRYMRETEHGDEELIEAYFKEMER